MTRFFALGALLVSLQVQPGFALDPEEAGRQARDDLDALLEKQRQEREAAAAKPKDAPNPHKQNEQAAPAQSANKPGRGSARAIENRIPTICTGCGAK